MKLLYDKSGAAEMLSMTEDRVDRMRRAGLLTAVLDGREHKYTLEALQEYVNKLPTSETRPA